ncbi:hypothetical protein C7212DRAFT_199469 [Tuber magnatum]|uniref:Protein kinase domain-containing protein n=1 Tax=Tuber magnatum TaxID=42249 RepID=A0A317SV79_9PEZI|nr:hypothetical protein C7212DRAFT_199469 [Tuber magnatum]
MPVRVQQQPQHSASNNLTNPTTTTTATAYSLRRGSPASSKGDDSSTSSISLGENGFRFWASTSAAKGEGDSDDINGVADGKQRKRLQKSHPETNNLPRSKPSLREPRSPQKVARSYRNDQKPLITRGQDYSLKSDNDGSSKHASSPVNSFASDSSRAYLQPPDSSESGVTTFYAFGQSSEGVQEALEPFSFSPSTNLEDVHRSIIDDDRLGRFPAPGRAGNGGNAERSTGRGTTREEGHQKNSAVASVNHANQSILRRPSVSKYSNNTQAQDNYRDRNRRQSNASNLSSATSSSTYRKTATTIEPESSIRAGQRRRPNATLAGNSLTPPMPQKEYIPGSGYSRNLDASYKASVSARNTKSKSLQPPPKTQQLGQPLKPSLTPEHARHSSIIYPPKSPKSPSVGKLGTPGKSGIPMSGSSRRISTIPHASGLGARTVSPTDARRLKRLSVIHTPTPPSMPFNAESSRSTPGSPSMLLRKSVTPSSSATTPEPQRKSYSSGLSTASTSTSARTSIGSTSLQPKVSQTFAASRLPKPPRAAVEREEEIPPVPPLPKNLVSPPFLDASTKPEVPEKPKAPETPRKPVRQERQEKREKPEKQEKIVKVDRETRRKRGMTLGGMGLGSAVQTLEPKSSASSLRKKDLVPLRLPPLNLLPLSTPTIARVNALGPQSDSEELTPPPKRNIKTPSTPMTASKAGFFGRRDRDEAAYHRSTSSINNATAQPMGDSPSSMSLRAGSSASSSIPVSASSRMGRQTISPYISSSLPKSVEHEGKAGDHKGARILGMPLSISRDNNKSRARKSQDSLRNAQEDVLDTPSGSSSIRRKLSLSWKKSSSSKHSHAATERADGYQAASKYDNMPPPKLPASATWAGPMHKPPSPVRGPQGAAAGSQGRRKSSIGNGVLVGQHDHARSNSWGTEGTSKDKGVENAEKAQPPLPPTKNSAASSILSPVSKMLGSKGSLGQLRSRNQVPVLTDPNMDHDDTIAEEEMRRIASKRKNLDAMAQELEELRRRAVPKDRMSAPQALRTVVLNIYERGEIVDFKDVYFTGTPGARKHVGDLNSTTPLNFGYDDERGDYTIVKGDHLAYRYEIVDILGKGSFGQVVRCIDHKTGGLVAVKIIRNKKRFHQQALVEVNILQRLKEWDPHGKHSLINFTQSFHFRGHLCISTELLGMNLYEFIKSNDFKGFSLRLIRRFTKQMLSSLGLLTGHHVIHCDLKPENILLAHPAKSEIKVIDFGSSCFEHEKVYTYIQSRFYRSPEVILGMTYGMPIDMWSLGCILAELLTGYPIFPGENEQEQLACIMEVFGPPEKHLIEKSTRKKLFFDSFGKPRMIVSSKGKRRRPSSKTLAAILRCDDEAFLDFIARCLRWDPDKRMKPDEAMHHDFITRRKTLSRPRTAGPLSNDPPVRRHPAPPSGPSTSYSASVSRPLPDPPATSAQKTRLGPSSVATGQNNSSQRSSPMKGYGAVKRNPSGSSMTGVKRNSMGAVVGTGASAVGSSLPRAARAEQALPSDW